MASSLIASVYRKATSAAKTAALVKVARRSDLRLRVALGSSLRDLRRGVPFGSRLGDLRLGLSLGSGLRDLRLALSFRSGLRTCAWVWPSGPSAKAAGLTKMAVLSKAMRRICPVVSFSFKRAWARCVTT